MTLAARCIGASSLALLLLLPGLAHAEQAPPSLQQQPVAAAMELSQPPEQDGVAVRSKDETRLPIRKKRKKPGFQTRFFAE